jgi:hypothetical protein
MHAHTHTQTHPHARNVSQQTILGLPAQIIGPMKNSSTIQTSLLNYLLDILRSEEA